MTPSLYETQRAIEEESVDLGIARYRKALAEDLGSVQPGMALMRRSIGPVAERIKTFIDECKSGKAGKGASIGLFLDYFDPEVVAFIALRKIISGLASRIPLTRLASSIGSYLEDAVNFETLRTEAPALYRQLQRRIATRKDSGVRHIVLRRQAKFAGIKTVRWDHTSKVKVGVRLIDFVILATGLVEVVTIAKKARDLTVHVIATPGTVAWLDQANARCELMAPLHLPMIVPPKEWSTPFNGGYLTQRLTLIKVRNRAYLNELAACDMPAVYGALNALQNTRWRINGAILGHLKAVWDSGRSTGALPSRDSLPLPLQPQADFDVPREERTEEQKERIKTWKHAANKVYAENMRLESKRVALTQKIWTAEKFAGNEAVYFPHVLDWRGRAYPVPAALSPQGDDVSKALLEFAEGKPLGENGAFWLAVHGANCFGVDKVAFEDRVKWIEENEGNIIDCAFEPERNTFWADADSPWQFLAFCKEWAGLYCYVRTADCPPAESFVSYLPVGLDGSCNGLQNFSAMLLDEVGGKATNLVPSAKPSDIYAEVARVSQKIVEFDHANGVQAAAHWLGKIDRKVTKRNCMTLAYGATQYGFKDQLLGVMQDYEDENGVPLIDEEHKFEAAVYLAGVNYNAIGQVVVAARKAMDWLISAARVTAQDKLPIRWTTPAGLPVLQNYRRTKGQKIEADIAGERVMLGLAVEGDALDKRKQAQGIAPNFVHSMDAAHMMATVNACREQGLTAFAMVHDSYGTHAADVDVLSLELRRAFIRQYAEDVLGQFREELVAQLPPKLAEAIPPLPPSGTLELADVEHSGYFFA